MVHQWLREVWKRFCVITLSVQGNFSETLYLAQRIKMDGMFTLRTMLRIRNEIGIVRLLESCAAGNPEQNIAHFYKRKLWIWSLSLLHTTHTWHWRAGTRAHSGSWDHGWKQLKTSTPSYKPGYMKRFQSSGRFLSSQQRNEFPQAQVHLWSDLCVASDHGDTPVYWHFSWWFGSVEFAS